MSRLQEVLPLSHTAAAMNGQGDTNLSKPFLHTRWHCKYVDRGSGVVLRRLESAPGANEADRQELNVDVEQPSTTKPSPPQPSRTFFPPLLSFCAVFWITSRFTSVEKFGQGRTCFRLRVTNRSILVMIVLLLTTKVLPSNASTNIRPPIVHVDQELGDDESCAPGGSACRSIGRGLKVAVANGIVMVAPGIYAGRGNCNISLSRPVTLMSSRGQDETFWDCEHKSRCLQIFANATVQGFTFQRGFVAPIANCSESDFNDPEQRDGRWVLRAGANASIKPSRVDNQTGSPRPDTVTHSTTRLGVSQKPQEAPQSAVPHGAPRSSKNAFLALSVPSSVGVTCVPFQSADDRDLERALHQLSIQDFIALRKAVLHIPLRGQEEQDKKIGKNKTVAAAVSVTDAGWSTFSSESMAHRDGQDPRLDAAEWESMRAHDPKTQHPRRHFPKSPPTPWASSPPHSSRGLLSSTVFGDDNLVVSAGGCILVAGVGIGVTIAHSAIIRGIAPYGGGIAFNGAHAVLSNVSVASNNAEWGGGLLAVGGTLQIVGSVMYSNSVMNRGPVVLWPNNAAVGAGVALFHVQHADVINSSITRNAGTSCGQCNKNHNCPESTGGGISSDGGIVSVSSSHVSNNSLACFGPRCDSAGGGIFNSGSLSVSSSHVTNNSLACFGSGCYSVGGGILNRRGSVSVLSSHVSSNNLSGEGAVGGGIWSSVGNVSVSSSHVASNYLSGSSLLVQGGAIYLFSCSISLASSNLTGNSLRASAGAAQGGAIWACCGTFLIASLTNVSHNAIWAPSAQGGALWMTRMTSWVRGCHLCHNRLVATFSASGGGIYAVSDVSLEVTASQVAYNVLPSNGQGAGGGLFLVNCDTHLVGTNVSNNQVSGAGGGGGLLVQGSGINSTVHLSGNTTITSNRAQIGGGLLVSGRVHASNIAVVNNSASGQGGAAFLSREADFVFHGTIANNTVGARSVGSVLFSAQQPRSNFSNNARLHLYGSATATAGWALVVNSLSSSQIKMGVQFLCQRGARMNFTNLESSQQETQILPEPCPAGCTGTDCCAAWPTQVKITPSFTNMTFVAVQCNPCDKGRYSLAMGSIHNSNSTNFCRQCPFGGDCPGGSTVGAQTGFWGVVQQDSDITFNRCPVGYCCPALRQGQSSCLFDHCEGNRTGILCGRCPHGMGNVFFSTRCTPDKDCTDAAWAIPLFLVALAVYPAYMVLAPCKSSTGLLTVIIFFYQVSSYVRGEAEWQHSSALAVSSIESIFLGGAFGGGGGSAPRGICVLPGMNPALVTASNYLVPLLVAFVMALWYAAVRLRDRNTGNHERASSSLSSDQSLMQRLRSATPGVASLVRLLLLSYSSLASTSLQLLVCRTITGVDGNNFRFFLDASVTCPAPWQLVPLLVLLGLLPLPVALVQLVHRHREQYPDAAALLQAPMAPRRRHWQAVMLYQRLVLAVLFTAIPEPLWRSVLVAMVCVVNLVLAVRFQPFHAAQGIYVSVLVVLVMLALLALPGSAKQSLSAPEQFGDNSANEAALEWLQFVLILSPGCVAVMSLAETLLRRVWSKLHFNGNSAAGADVQLSQIEAASPANDIALRQA